MAKITGFLDYERHNVPYRDEKTRIGDYREMYHELDDEERIRQGARCMDCGIPFCQSEFGCPVDNLIPEWNDLIYKKRWKEAYLRLRLTNNFPEFTGRICPAPCESSCVLGINQDPVTIKDNEFAIAERALNNNWLVANIPPVRTDKRIAVVGSGPAGLAAADQLNQSGHTVHVYEREDRIGGLLMYGIPNMKLDKKIIDVRIDIMKQEGIEFFPNTTVGQTVTIEQLQQSYDAVVLAIGATVPLDLPIPNRDATGIHYAMEFLTHSMKSILNKQPESAELTARDKHVIVIGSGDTGTDCVATAVRQGAKSITSFAWKPSLPNTRTEEYPWPFIPKIHKFDYGHKEVKQKHGEDPRVHSIVAKAFDATNGKVSGIRSVQVKWDKDPLGKPHYSEVSDSQRVWQADLVLLALGYSGPDLATCAPNDTLHTKSSTEPTDNSGNAHKMRTALDYSTTSDGVFIAGDARMGQSLVVWAIKEGRIVAEKVEQYLAAQT